MARLIAVSVILSLFTVFSALAQPIAYIGSNNTNEVSIIDVPSNRVVASGPFPRSRDEGIEPVYKPCVN